MKKILLRILMIIGIVVLAVVMLLVGGTTVLNTKTVQRKIMRHSTNVLSEKLQTKVNIDNVSVDVVSQSLQMRDVMIEDLDHREMLKIGELDVKMDIIPLVTKKMIKVKSARLIGLKAMLLNPGDGRPANYQFVIDAFKDENELDISTNETIAADTLKTDTLKKKKNKLTFDIDQLLVENIDLTYNDKHLLMQHLDYDKPLIGSAKGRLKNLSFDFVRQTKKGLQDCHASIGNIIYRDNDSRHTLNIERLCFSNDNHLPRKNADKPKRGAFDDGHIDAIANAIVTIEHIDKDTLVASVDHLDAIDETAGIIIKNLNLRLQANKRQAVLNDINIQLPETKLAIKRADVQLPSKKEGRGLQYVTSPIKGRVILRDIAKPFAPVLSDFTMPLDLNVVLTGDSTSMNYQDITVGTEDGRLNIAARGTLKNLKNKYNLAIRFHVDRMTARNHVAEDIIALFPVKKMMMKQLANLGTVRYAGNVDILWKKEQFRGLLNTDVGELNFGFTLDEANKMLLGHASSDNLELGRAFEVKGLGQIIADANFRFDIHKGRTAEMRKKYGGKLPIGEVNANVKEVKWKKITIRNLDAEIKSNGAIADGNIAIKGRHTDLLCAFSFTNTDSIGSKLKVKPGIRFHGLTDEQRQEKAEQKAKKEQEREALKEQKALERAEKKALRKKEKEERHKQKKGSQ